MPTQTNPAATQNNAAAAAPQDQCRIMPLPANGFQKNAADMPVTCLLSTPDNKTKFFNVNVFNAADGSIVPSQPTNLTDTSFSLDLAAGAYRISVVVGSLPGAQPVRILESCRNQTKLEFINVPASNNGEFRLAVI